MACEQVCNNKAVVHGWMEKGKPGIWRQFQVYCSAPGAWAIGSLVGKGCQQRVATLASATWGCQNQASLNIERGSWTFWGDEGL